MEEAYRVTELHECAGIASKLLCGLTILSPQYSSKHILVRLLLRCVLHFLAASVMLKFISILLGITDRQKGISRPCHQRSNLSISLKALEADHLLDTTLAKD